MRSVISAISAMSGNYTTALNFLPTKTHSGIRLRYHRIYINAVVMHPDVNG